ncbi:MAG: hypothetical protein Q4A71_08290 [Actinomycetaceae bacterium]|nr:hypothetical protein [Actinomycetaceae bacterium]
MGVSGIVLFAVVAIALAVVLPGIAKWQVLAAKRNENDRFSADMRVLDLRTQVEPGGSHSGKLFLTGGRQMSQQERSALVTVRAARAAAVARRAAAARRRLALAGALLVLTVIMAVLGVVQVVALAWAAVPLVGLVATLVSGRRAALAAKRNDADDLERIRQLREQALLGVGRPVPQNRRWESLARLGDFAPKNAAANGEGEAAISPAGAGTGDTGEGAYRVDQGATVGASSAPSTNVGTEAVQGVKSGEAATGGVASSATGGKEDRTRRGMTWSPMPIPAPSYRMKAMVQPRGVQVSHMRGETPTIGVAVPYRPGQVGGLKNTVSTEEVVATALVRMDGDDMLDARRANAS